ncbi:regulator [Streptomyces agglomeratus]|uniref:Regulator n=1 Tax=Streptomyces agglomeratus TaxID=285458 RepID=A0A1E5PE76_9ACTN|nr:AAA family ATPase [Streptomyces agglomeratus]OEJ27839.1 regulator [Streptomyces agglomeratus]OEJ38102.1 regulator [Streptomyces agglomeratus]OEJ47515.1 regulator [Streptomyces agglomeratus]OEJ50629.1 regulator [Streptomyces agglomeratus]OEJ57991.1 regulator [Streptomyces agglomeratus]
MRRTPPPVSHSPAHGGLPAELNPFVGRRAELAELGRLLEDARLVTVTGVGGVGKTRFALRAACELKERYCDGVRLTELSALTDPGLLEHAVVEALGLTDHSGKPPRTVLVEHLAERRLLLVLDGFEHLVDAVAGLVRELLRRAPELTVLATGRLPLSIDGEQTFPLPPMPDSEAVRLFTDRAAAGQPGFRLTDANRSAVHELCRRLDGIPLALELAAGRLRALSVEQVLERLDHRFRLLTGSTRGALPRHQTLRTAIGWSHELCTPEQRLLWARLSVFAGQFDLEAAEYVCGGPELLDDRVLGVLDVLTDLIAQSVVIREDSPAGVRYRMLDTVREYGADWLAAMGDAERVRRTHRDWYLGLATWCELDWFSPRQAEVAARVDSELPNLRRAMEYSLEHPRDVHLGQYLAGTLWFYWVGCGHLSEGRHWLDHALEPEGEHEAHRLKALWVLGYVAVLQGDAIGALAALQECREGAELSGNALAAAYAVHRSGCLALVSDDMPRAEELLREALARYEEIGELNSNVLMARIELAMAVAFRGDLAHAVAICEEVTEVCEDHGERWALAYALYVRAYAACTDGRPDRARELLVECLAIDHAFNDLLGAVLALELLALVTLDAGDPAEAAVLQGAAERIWPSVGLPLFGSAYYNAPHSLCEERARERLGDGRYEALRHEGAALGLDAAVARALEGPRRPAPGAPKPRAASAPAARDSAPHTREPAASRSVRNEETTG